MESKNYFIKKTNFTKLSILLFSLLALSGFSQPNITLVSPTIVTNSTVITITGTNFGTTPTVTIGGSSANITITQKSNTLIKITVNSAASGSLVVTGGGGSTGTNTYSTPISYVTPIVKNSASGIHASRIISDYNGYWSSTAASSVAANQPNTRHDLLGFQYNGVVYSTGVDDAKLTANGVTFVPQRYRAYSTRGVSGKTHSNLFLAMADLIDGTVHDALADPTSPEIVGLSVYDVLIDGANGLDLGTGITNFNTDASISFYSDNIQPGPSNAYFSDAVPDVLITQIADPGGTDYYHFSDINGNIVGNPVQLAMTGIPAIGRYRLDLFTFPNSQDLNTATPNGRRAVDSRTRDIRLVGLKFSDFGINASNYSQVNSFDMLAGGGADISFLAYNTASFEIKSPIVTSAPNSLAICALPYNNSVTFSIGAGIEGGGSGVLNYQWKKNNVNIPGATSDSYTIPGPITNSNFATYKVEVSNTFGAIVASSAVLKLGGTPAVWNGTSWNETPTSSSSLIFSGNYDSATQLSGTTIQGCDCTVQNNANVIIDSGDTMVLQNYLKVATATSAITETIPAYCDGTWVDGVCVGTYHPEQTVTTPAQPAGTFTLRDDASLVQVSETAVNSGVISSKRNVTNLHTYDYVYWSSPVVNFDLSGLSAYSTPMYQWNPTVVNPNSTYGNWVAASGTMQAGKGYISRVSNANDFEVTFNGTPNNGVYQLTLTGNPNAVASTNYWNLIGNPYPSPISAKDFITSNPDIEGNVRLWTHGSPIGTNNPSNSPFYSNFSHNYGDQYITYNATASVPPGFNGYIASGQGFFVQGKTVPGLVKFQNTFRYRESLSPYNNSQFYRTASEDGHEDLITEEESSIIWLSLVNSESTSANTAVGYVEGATLGKDQLFDATTIVGDFEIYSLIENEADAMIIQGRPLPFVDTDTVSVGVAVPSNGIYSIAIDQVQGVFEDPEQDIYLEDTFTGITHDLKASPYSFTAGQGNYPARFILKYLTSNLSIDEVKTADTFAFIAQNTLQVQSKTDIEKIDIYEVSGKRLASYSTIATGKQFKTGFNFSKGIYFATIILADGTTVTKKLINN